ncbi:MAG TPA: DMT family transporter [Burkholderiaceae bacterium]|nr:DMT family transporter [Burkholderiaceae bacterium]
MSGPPWAAYASLGASMALVGSYVGLSKLLLAVFPVFLLAWLRFGIAALAMLSWLPRQPGEAPLSSHDRRLLFWESFLGNFLFSICMLYGVLLSSAVAAGVVMAAIPAAVAVLSRLFLHELISRRVMVAIGCAVAGIGTLALGRAGPQAESAAGEHPVLGHLLLVAAAVCEASYVVIGKRLTGQVSAKRISALINMWGLLLITPLGLWQAWSHDFARVPLPTWGLLLFYSLAASVATVWLWMRGLRQVQASRAGVFTVLLPVSSAVVGVTILHEPFSSLYAAAFVLSLGGLLLATWPASVGTSQTRGVRA